MTKDLSFEVFCRLSEKDPLLTRTLEILGGLPLRISLPFILFPNRNRTVLPAKFAPCFVKVLDHISPLCSAAFASPDTNFDRNSLSAFYQGIVLGG